ncbi:MAG TPA: lysylphosphatidylglycerol synthase domain-containing protein [Myxococcota bacterium]|nr:lysylphosphatidylglycerol synthase domain-containing protein [Myxococcota bacterium]
MAPRVRPAPALRGLLPWLLAAGLIGLLLWQVPFEAMGRALHGARLGVFLPGAAVASLVWFALDSATLAQLFSRAFTPLGWAEARALRGLSYLATPIHWHAGKAAIVARLRRTKGLPILDATSGLLLVQTLDALILALLATGGSWLLPTSEALVSLRGVGMVVAVASVAYLIVVRSDRPALPVLERLRRSAVHRAHRRLSRADLARLFALKTAYHLVFVVAYLVGLRAFGVDVTLARSLAATPIVQMVGSLPLTPAGLGTQQGAMLHLFGGIGPGATSAPAILAFGFAFPIVLMGMRCAIGLCYLGRLRRASERGGRADGRGGAVHARAGPAER